MPEEKGDRAENTAWGALTPPCRPRYDVFELETSGLETWHAIPRLADGHVRREAESRLAGELCSVSQSVSTSKRQGHRADRLPGNPRERFSRRS
jgi:hypothetical protein